jgi:hypothetical protein
VSESSGFLRPVALGRAEAHELSLERKVSAAQGGDQTGRISIANPHPVPTVASTCLRRSCFRTTTFSPVSIRHGAPAGEAVVAMVEPADRNLTLRDLEPRYYRVVLREPELERHLSATGERFAYTAHVAQ